MSYITPLLNSLMMAAKKAGNGLTRDFNEIEKLQSSVKGHKEFVAAAFAKVEKTLRTELAKAKPDYPFAVDGAKRPDGPLRPPSSITPQPTNYILPSAGTGRLRKVSAITSVCAFRRVKTLPKLWFRPR